MEIRPAAALAKTSSTMLVIFLGTFHDRCRRFGSHSFERFFFLSGKISMWYFFAAAAMVPDICLWVLRCAMKKFRPCSVIRCGHIHSMLPCFFLAKPEFFSLPLAKTSNTMPVIFLGTFHDRCRRFGSHSFERFFFLCLQTYVCGK